MTTAIVSILALAIIGVSYFAAQYVFKTKKCAVRAVRTNLVVFVVLSVLLFSVGMGVSAASEEPAAPVATSETAVATEETATESGDNSINQGLAFIASALAIGLAGIGGGIAVAAGAPAAIGATSEDPKNFGKALIFVALGEGIAIYGLLISFLIYSAASSM